MAPTKNTPAAKPAEKPQEAAGTDQQKTTTEVQSGTPNDAPPPPAPSSDPVGEEAQRRAEEARIQQTPDAEREDGEGDEGKPQELSKKKLKAGDTLWYRGDYGPVFALVAASSEGEAEVFLIRDSEVVRARTVAVYDHAEDAERAAREGRAHVAWMP